MTFTLVGMFKSGNIVRAQEMIHYALKSVHAVEHLIFQQVKWRNSFIFIQKRLNDRQKAKTGLVNVMLTYWDKLYGQIMFKASQYKDDYVLEVLTQIARVSLEVKTALAKYYITKC